MIISVWNHSKDDFANEFSAVFGAMLAHMYRCKILLYENSTRKRCLGDVLINSGYSDELKRGSSFYSGLRPGEGLINWVSKKYLKPCIGQYVNLLDSCLYYSPHYNDLGKEPFELKLYEEINEKLYNGDLFADITLVNTENNSNLTTNQILSISDKIIVLIDDTVYAFQQFINQYKSIIYKCIFVIFKPYKKRLREIYSQTAPYHIERKQILSIAYTEEFIYSCDMARVIDYVRCNYNCPKISEEYNFINDIINLAGYVVGNNKKEIGIAEGSGSYWYLRKINYDEMPRRGKSKAFENGHNVP